ncbi:glycine betaine/proline transport system substrate-binding protein [Alkalihalobacillus xiaoxiensis]|uniref:Glycine betaine/proline transport system substrate-binding protein n=1 Tax=Shouchella xiaoxiensis TaxID=766895 RepID=A0ABS2STT1_9BACI|nr:glycine betaine ABC transporter substrate-binding protein [Shouchella xiaoxiensis]MBM7838918.1 glycine betaine/proline transport system substrate-binding protein [Shouchella xiaoxiensis]
MQKKLWSMIAVASIVLAACGNDDTSEGTNTKEIELTYVAWDSELASNHVIKEALEQAGYDVTLTVVEQSVMWQSVAGGDVDGHVAGWLPEDMRADYERYENEIVDLGANLEGAQTGLAVPTYMDVESIADLTPEIVNEITGIDAGAGVMIATEKAVEEYDLDLAISSSMDAFMTQQLGDRYEAEEPIVVTAWQPHWKFNSYDLRFLEDPLGVFEANGEIRTIVREGLEEEDPDAFRILDQFYWTPDDMNEVMLNIAEEGMDPEDAAKLWVEDNQEQVDEWLEGVE